jgi:hypothetical protein
LKKKSPKVAHINDADLTALQIALSVVLNNPGNYNGMDDPDDVDDPFRYQG